MKDKSAAVEAAERMAASALGTAKAEVYEEHKVRIIETVLGLVIAAGKVKQVDRVMSEISEGVKSAIEELKQTDPEMLEWP